ncbi:MAG: iron-containing alcohol dehydrogenase family protein [Trichlorobacter sp.]|nr:iron-containing alcohol dehydrogenase family protein [Trichlorobacter sp.]
MEIKIPSLLRIKPNALHKLGKYVRQESFTKVAVFWGTGIKNLFSNIIDVSFASSSIEVVYEEEVTGNNIDDAFAASKRLPFETQLVIAVGGGMAVDYCKYVAFSRQLQMFAVPTLISNDAFASAISSLVIDGTRKSVKTVVPNGVIIDTAVISNAPRQFLYSGIGDLFCKTTAVFDWKLAYKKAGTPVNDFAATVATKAADTFSYYTPKDCADVEFTGIIASSLLMTGIAMIIANNSRPASGAEHLISHAYDQVSQKPSLHGLQVGVAALGTAFLQQFTYERVKKDVLESGFFSFMSENPLHRAEFMEAIRLAPEIKDNFYTVLSEKGALRRLEQFVMEDEMMNKMVV